MHHDPDQRRRFVDEFGPQADALGWDTLTLFSVHPKSGAIRGDWCGVLIPCSYPMHEVTAERMRKHIWTVCKAQPVRLQSIPVWEFGR